MASRLSLSKSQYIRGLQCPQSLYLHKFNSDLRNEISTEQQAVFSWGTDVGILAQKLFPGGIEIPFDGLSVVEQVEMTRKAIARKTPTIYEASFLEGGIFIKVDILHRGTKGWELYEVKSATKVKPVNLDDIALQYYVLKGAGIKICKAYLTHINSSYVRKKRISVKKLFAHADVTAEVKERQGEIPDTIKNLRKLLKKGLPDVGIGPHCFDPYDCDFSNHCWQHIPEDSVFSLAGRGIDKFDYYRQSKINLADLPLDELNASQRFQIEMHLKQGQAIDKKGINEFLGTLWYPLCFFDFETFTSAVPLYEGTRPYQQIPFQFSLHIQKQEGGPVQHIEFLAEPNCDPRPALIEAMLTHIPKKACVLAYYMAFEKSRISELIDAFPEHADGLMQILNNIRDLIVPFKKCHAYRWQQRGSNSIKNVLPAFVPELSYEDLAISNGSMAMDAYHLMCQETNPEQLKILREQLKDYCRLDTEAMVRLHETLTNLATGK